MATKGFNVGNPVKIVEDGNEFNGLQGTVKGHDTNGDYWVQVEGHEGCFRFPKDSLKLNVTSNILEIVTDDPNNLPEGLSEELYKAKALGHIMTEHFAVFKFDLMQYLWKDLDDELAGAKNDGDIVDYKATYWSITPDYTVRPR